MLGLGLRKVLIQISGLQKGLVGLQCYLRTEEYDQPDCQNSQYSQVTPECQSRRGPEHQARHQRPGHARYQHGATGG